MSDTPNPQNDLLALLQNKLNNGEEFKIKSKGKKVRISIPAEQLTSHPNVNQEKQADAAFRRGPNGRIPPQWRQEPFPPQFPPQWQQPLPPQFPPQWQQPLPPQFPPQWQQPLPPQLPPQWQQPLPPQLPPQWKPLPPNPFPLPDPNPGPGKIGPSYVNIMVQDPATTITIDGKQSSLLRIQLPDGLPANLQGQDIILSATNRASMPPIIPDVDNNVLLDPVRNPRQFEAVSVYATVKLVKNMYEKALGKRLIPSWGDTPIQLILNDQEEANAFFAPIKKALIFRFFRDITSGQTVYTDLMFDVISHEVGHFVLDCLERQWILSSNPETGAIHEAFGDMTTLLALLSLPPVCEALAKATGGDLHIKSFFSNFSEQFGVALLRKNDGLRNADDDVKMGQVSKESHDLSRVLVGAVYDMIAEMVKQSKQTQPAEKLPEVLHEVGEQMKHMVLQAVINAPARDATFKDIITGMSNAAPTPAIKNIVDTIAATKLIGAPGVVSMPAPMPLPIPGGTQWPQPAPFPQPRQAYLPFRAVVDEEGKHAEEEEVLECPQTVVSRAKRARAGK
jgi:hypothetical protein